jgi:hypothetical protein
MYFPDNIITNEEDQDLGSFEPSFGAAPGTGFSVNFRGPLFRVVEVTGEDSLSEPLPRLLAYFFYAFNRTRELLRGPNLIFWARNRIRVVIIADRYIENSQFNQYYCLHQGYARARRIIINCACCTSDGPCLLCEFNTQSIAFLFRVERPHIRAHRFVLQIVARSAPNRFETAIISRIVEYLLGPRDWITNIREVTLNSIFFIQNSLFAPEIRSIISRQQLITWATAIRERRIRPFRQGHRFEGQHPHSGDHWPFGAYLLRAFPVCSLDPDWIGPIIHISERTPTFLTIEDYTWRPSTSVILANRERNSDYWLSDSLNSTGSEYLGYDDHSFTFPSSVVGIYHSLADQTSDEEN